MSEIKTNQQGAQDRRVAVATIYAALCHAVLFRLGHPSHLLQIMPEQWRGSQIQLSVRALWAGLHLLIYAIIPWIIAKGMGVTSIHIGLTTGAIWKSRRLLMVVGIAALPVVFLVSFVPGFLRAYPMFRMLRIDWPSTLAWLLLFANYLFSIEFFFRGFLPAMLTPALGRYSLFVALIPYVATHSFLPEAIGAIPVGILLGMLRMQTGSLWPGYLAHLTVALEIELIALHRQGLW